MEALYPGKLTSSLKESVSYSICVTRTFIHKGQNCNFEK